MERGNWVIEWSSYTPKDVWTWRRRAVRPGNGSAVEIPFSTILVEGVSPGKTELFLHWPNSVKQSVVVNVKAKTPR